MKAIKYGFMAGAAAFAAYSLYIVSETNRLLRERDSLLTFAGVESLASGESGGIIGPCQSVEIQKSISYQECLLPSGGISSVPWRVDYESVCQGSDDGYCEAGMLYVYYDCLGDYINTVSLTEPKKCQ